MSIGNHGNSGIPTPSRRTPLVVAACVCLLIPIVALMWVGSYDKVTPKLGGIPFFFWYQFLWVFICSGLTYLAYRLMLASVRRGDGRAADGERGESR